MPSSHNRHTTDVKWSLYINGLVCNASLVYNTSQTVHPNSTAHVSLISCYPGVHLLHRSRPHFQKKLIYFLVFDRFSAGECALQVTTLSKMLFLPPAPRLRGLVQDRRLSSKASFLDPAGYAGLLRTNVHVRTLFTIVGRNSRTLRSMLF